MNQYLAVYTVIANADAYIVCHFHLIIFITDSIIVLLKEMRLLIEGEREGMK